MPEASRGLLCGGFLLTFVVLYRSFGFVKAFPLLGVTADLFGAMTTSAYLIHLTDSTQNPQNSVLAQKNTRLFWSENRISHSEGRMNSGHEEEEKYIKW